MTCKCYESLKHEITQPVNVTAIKIKSSNKKKNLNTAFEDLDPESLLFQESPALKL